MVKDILPYFKESMIASSDAFSSENSDGYVNFSIAENRQCAASLRQKLVDCAQEEPDHLFYDDMKGKEKFRSQIAGYLERTVVGRKVDPSHVCASSGVGACLEMLSFALCEDGESMLIPAPYYTGFDNDTGIRPGLALVPCERRAENNFSITRESLDDAKKRAEREGTPARCLLISNPDNPTGLCFSESDVQMMVDWCRDNKIHGIFDEIYANSVYGNDEFNSVTRVTGNDMGDYVHALFGMSKDFGLSGYRIGFIYTQNKELMSAINMQSYFCAISCQTQTTIGGLLSDAPFIDSFIKENNEKLKHLSTKLLGELQAGGIRCVVPSAGFFIFLNLSELMEEDTVECEKKLWMSLFNESKVLFTPGFACHSEENGWFRCCFAAVDEDAMMEGCRRIIDFVNARRRH